MKMPWHFYLAFKQLFPTGRWVSFFSVLAIVGVALGVNVMIVVVAFMKGFQAQFRDDVLDTYGEIRVLAMEGRESWPKDLAAIEADPAVQAATPFMQGFVFLDFYGQGRVPSVTGVDPEKVLDALPLDKFIREASAVQRYAYYASPDPTLDDLDDETVLLSAAMGDRIGAHPPLILFDKNSSLSNAGDGQPKLTRVSALSVADLWTLTFDGPDTFQVKAELQGPEDKPFRLGEGPYDLAGGMITLELAAGKQSFAKGDVFRFEILEASTVEVYAPVMLDRARRDELTPPRELRVAGFFEAPWRQFGEDSIICSLRLLQELNGQEGLVHGFNLRLQPGIVNSDAEVEAVAARLDAQLGEGYRSVTWFDENAWFFDLLKFEEYLMILIMVPIGLVAAFAIAIALMTSVIRRTREIGLLVAMGGTRAQVGAVFCLQGLVIGGFGTLAGWSLASLMIHFRRSMMEVIVPLFADQVNVEQYYHFLTLKVYQPWESPEILQTFLVAGCFGLVVSTLAGLLPAWKAASLKPADALRSE